MQKRMKQLLVFCILLLFGCQPINSSVASNYAKKIAKYDGFSAIQVVNVEAEDISRYLLKRLGFLDAIANNPKSYDYSIAQSAPFVAEKEINTFIYNELNGPNKDTISLAKIVQNNKKDPNEGIVVYSFNQPISLSDDLIDKANNGLSELGKYYIISDSTLVVLDASFVFKQDIKLKDLADYISNQ